MYIFGSFGTEKERQYSNRIGRFKNEKNTSVSYRTRVRRQTGLETGRRVADGSTVETFVRKGGRKPNRARNKIERVTGKIISLKRVQRKRRRGKLCRQYRWGFQWFFTSRFVCQTRSNGPRTYARAGRDRITRGDPDGVGR